MKIIGLSGSPRIGGNSETLLYEFVRGAQSKDADTKIIRVCDLHAAGCDHCDACMLTGECTLFDDVMSVYDDIAAADGIVVASPLHFMSVPAQLKAVIDRAQANWVRKHVMKSPPLGDERPRKGFLIAVGGRKSENLFDPIRATIKAWFATLGIKYTGELLLADTDDIGAAQSNTEALRAAFAEGSAFVA